MTSMSTVAHTSVYSCAVKIELNCININLRYINQHTAYAIKEYESEKH